MKTLIRLVLFLGISLGAIAQQTYDFPTPGEGWSGWTESLTADSGDVNEVSGNIGVMWIFATCNHPGPPTWCWLYGNRTWMTWAAGPDVAQSVEVIFRFAGDQGQEGYTEVYTDGTLHTECHPFANAPYVEDLMYAVASGNISASIGIPAMVLSPYAGGPNKSYHADYTEVDLIDGDQLISRALLMPALPATSGWHRLKLDVSNWPLASVSIDGVLKVSGTVQSDPGQVGIWEAVAPRKTCISPGEVIRQVETHLVTAE